MVMFRTFNHWNNYPSIIWKKHKCHLVGTIYPILKHTASKKNEKHVNILESYNGAKRWRILFIYLHCIYKPEFVARYLLIQFLSTKVLSLAIVISQNHKEIAKSCFSRVYNIKKQRKAFNRFRQGFFVSVNSLF